MTKTKNLLRGAFLALMFATIILQGCAYNIPLKKDAVIFQKRTDVLPLHAALFLTDEVRNYVVTEKWQGTDFNFQVGEVLEENALISLKEIFQMVCVLPARNDVISDIDRIISIKFGYSSRFEHGAVDWLSEHTATIELLWEVYDDKWNLLSEGTSLGTASGKMGAKRATASFLTLTLGATYLHNKTIGEIASKSLAQALEKLNDQILVSERDAILQTGNRE
jgi:hypothetical protein